MNNSLPHELTHSRTPARTHARTKSSTHALTHKNSWTTHSLMNLLAHERTHARTNLSTHELTSLTTSGHARTLHAIIVHSGAAHSLTLYLLTEEESFSRQGSRSRRRLGSQRNPSLEGRLRLAHLPGHKPLTRSSTETHSSRRWCNSQRTHSRHVACRTHPSLVDFVVLVSLHCDSRGWLASLSSMLASHLEHARARV